MSATDLLSLFRRELELCKVKPGEVMAVLSGPNTLPAAPRRDHMARGHAGRGPAQGPAEPPAGPAGQRRPAAARRQLRATPISGPAAHHQRSLPPANSSPWSTTGYATDTSVAWPDRREEDRRSQTRRRLGLTSTGGTVDTS